MRICSPFCLFYADFATMGLYNIIGDQSPDLFPVFLFFGKTVEESYPVSIGNAGTIVSIWISPSLRAPNGQKASAIVADVASDFCFSLIASNAFWVQDHG
jgi:hypothetical protein